MTPEKMQAILEAALMVAGQPLNIGALQRLFSEEERPSTSEVRALLGNIRTRHMETGIELKEVANGFRLQAKAELSPWLAKLWEERAPRYSRAFLETLAIIAYKQPITRGEIEAIRGVTVSSQIMKSLQERDWIQIVGYREVPGKPGLYGTTKAFLDYFNLKSLSELPTLTEFTELTVQEEQLQVQLAIEGANVGPSDSEQIPEENMATDSDSEQGPEENTPIDNVVNFSQLANKDEDEHEHEKASQTE